MADEQAVENTEEEIVEEEESIPSEEKTEEEEESVPSEEKTEEEEESVPSDVEELDEQPKEKKSVQKRINELTRQRYEAEARANAAEARIAITEKQLQATTQAPPPGELAPPERVTLESCGYDDALFAERSAEYNERLIAYKVDRKIAEQNAAIAQERRVHAFNVKRDTVVKAGQDKYEDFNDVVFSVPGNIFHQGVVDDFLETNNPDEIAYYLGTHLDEAEAVSKMGSRARAIYMGRLDERISKRPKKVTNAPKPLTPVKGRGASVIKEEDLSMDEWVKQRRDGKIK